MAPSKDRPSLTIVTVVRNDLNGLQRTLNSILRQSDTEFQWLIVDGESNDGTEILAKKLKESKTAHLISVPPRGIYEAMNHGIAHSSGDYLLFLNAGDFLISESSVSRVRSLLSVHGQSLALPVIQINSSGDIVDIAIPALKSDFANVVMDSNHQGFIMKRSASEKLGNFDLSLRYAADGKLMDGIATTEGVTLDFQIVTAFVLGGASSLNISDTLREINTYRHAISKNQVTATRIKTIIRSKAHNSDKLVMRIINLFLSQKARSRVAIKLSECEVLEHWHKQDVLVPNYKCCLTNNAQQR